MRRDRKSRLITICMLAAALVMIGLALTGTLQMRVSHSPKLVSSRLIAPSELAEASVGRNAAAAGEEASAPEPAHSLASVHQLPLR